MAFIPISPAHQTRWHKTKPFPLRKILPTERQTQHSFPADRILRTLFHPQKSDALWDFTLHRLKLLNMLGSKMKLVKQLQNVAVTCTVCLSSLHRHNWMVTILLLSPVDSSVFSLVPCPGGAILLFFHCPTFLFIRQFM